MKKLLKGLVSFSEKEKAIKYVKFIILIFGRFQFQLQPEEEYRNFVQNVKKKKKKKSIETLQRDLISSDLARSYKVFSNNSIVSDELKNANLENYNITDPFDEKAIKFTKRIARHYFKGGEGNTVFIGVPGVGKSHLTISMARSLNDTFKKYNEPKSIVFMPVNRIFSKIKSSFNNKSSVFTEDYAIDFLSKVDYLFLDDLGKESSMSNQIKPASDWVQSVLFSILDQRKNTIINTNFSRDQLLKIYDLCTSR